MRDRHFILRTDHKNLIYLNDSASAKVRRWKILISEYDFDIEYIKGEENFVADATSRLVNDTRLVDDGVDEFSALDEQSGEIKWCHQRDRRITLLGTRWGRRIPMSGSRACETRTPTWDVASQIGRAHV